MRANVRLVAYGPENNNQSLIGGETGRYGKVFEGRGVGDHYGLKQTIETCLSFISVVPDMGRPTHTLVGRYILRVEGS